MKEQARTEPVLSAITTLVYSKPELTRYGLVAGLTQSTGSQNGDGGQNMMT